MAKKRNPETAAKEARMQAALAALRDGKYKNPNEAAPHFQVSRKTLYARWNGQKSRTESLEEYQSLTPPEEKELVR